MPQAHFLPVKNVLKHASSPITISPISSRVCMLACARAASLDGTLPRTPVFSFSSFNSRRALAAHRTDSSLEFQVAVQKYAQINPLLAFCLDAHTHRHILRTQIFQVPDLMPAAHLIQYPTQALATRLANPPFPSM